MYIALSCSLTWVQSGLLCRDPATHKEFQQGANLAKAAKQAGVEVFIWSSLPNVLAISGGKLVGPK